MLKNILLISIICLLTTSPVSAKDPMEVIETAINQIVDLLHDPQFDPPEKKEEQRDKIWNVVENVFNFPVIARGTLRRFDWESFSQEQQEEFTKLFKKLLVNTYLGRLQSDYQNEEVVFEDQEMLSETTALVRTKVIREDIEVPVVYRMLLRDGTWSIYNVHVENISLVTNYRDQFSRILMKNTPEQFLDQLRDRVKKADYKADS